MEIIDTFTNYKSNNFGPKSNFIKIEELGIYTYFIIIGNMKYGGGEGGFA